MNESKNSDTFEPNSPSDSFMRILIYDVALSINRRDQDDTQTARRDLVRTIFAAIEGLSWVYRVHVRTIACDIDSIPPIMELALSEKTYAVDEAGLLHEQTRFISTPAMIRFTSRLAQQICPELEIDFSVQGWSNLKQAIIVRNRITHPKNSIDLEISSQDIDISQRGIFWLLDLICNVMEAMNATATVHLGILKVLVNQLLSGDPSAVVEYQHAFKNMDN